MQTIIRIFGQLNNHFLAEFWLLSKLNLVYPGMYNIIFQNDAHLMHVQRDLSVLIVFMLENIDKNLLGPTVS